MATASPQVHRSSVRSCWALLFMQGLVLAGHTSHTAAKRGKKKVTKGVMEVEKEAEVPGEERGEEREVVGQPLGSGCLRAVRLTLGQCSLVIRCGCL